MGYPKRILELEREYKRTLSTLHQLSQIPAIISRLDEELKHLMERKEYLLSQLSEKEKVKQQAHDIGNELDRSIRELRNSRGKK